MSFTRGITYGGRPVQCADARQYPLAAGKANGYSCPIGPTPGMGYVLMLLSDLRNISTATGHELVMFCSGDQGLPATRLTFRNLFVVKATRVTGGYSGDPNALMLVELADRRWHLNRWTCINKQYNVSAPCAEGYLTESRNGGSDWTWTTLVGDLWSQAGLGTAPSIPSGSSIGPPSSLLTEEPNNLKFVGVNAWQALNGVLHTLRCTTRYNPFSDTFDIISFDEAQNDLVPNQAEYYGDVVSGVACRAPATIRVFFHYAEQDTGQENDTGTSSNFASTPAYTVDVATGISGAVAGSVLPLWDDMSAEFLHGESALTSAQITALSAKATQRANAWLEANARNNGLRNSAIRTGLINKPPGGKIKQIIWRDYGPEYGGLVTEVCRSPGVPGIDTLMGGGGSDNFGPPPHDPTTWPERAQPVKLVSATKADSSNDLYDGKVCRYISTATGGSFTDYEDCYIYFLESSPTLSANDRFIGRLCGLVTSNTAVTRPLYLVRAGATTAGTTGLMLFAVGATALTRSLDQLTDATCVWAIGGGTLPASMGTVTVKNPPSNATSTYWYAAASGQYGLAVNVDGNWWILRMEPVKQTGAVVDVNDDGMDMSQDKKDFWLDFTENPTTETINEGTEC